MANKGRVESYVSRDGADIGTPKSVGHMDALVFLLREIT
jgi:hypothetical protein